jgi:hypothetical protein
MYEDIFCEMGWLHEVWCLKWYCCVHEEGLKWDVCVKCGCLNWYCYVRTYI